MKLFDLFKKRKKDEPMTNTTFDETGYICNGCGTFNPLRFKYCPYCGTERFAMSENNHIKIQESKEQDFSQKDEITEYLGKRNLLHLADRQFLINIQLENGEIKQILLFGRQNSDDALEYLRDVGFLGANEQYHFTDWPHADPCIGPMFFRMSACVCELDHNSIYHVEGFNPADIRVLYGCPNSKSVITHTVLDQVKVEIIDYEN